MGVADLGEMVGAAVSVKCCQVFKQASLTVRS